MDGEFLMEQKTVVLEQGLASLSQQAVSLFRNVFLLMC